VYDVALSVAACLRAGTRVDVAWVVDGGGLTIPADDALALTPGGGRVGSLLSGALDDRLAELASGGTSGRLVDLRISEVEALVAGLTLPADLRCLLVPATDLPADLWERLRLRQPVALVARLDGDAVTGVELVTPDGGDEAARLFDRRASSVAVAGDRITTVLWPVSTLVVIGTSAMADALSAAAGLLGWRVQQVGDQPSVRGFVAGLAAIDSVVVTGHDDDLCGAALAAALDSSAGYIGSVGPARLQQARLDWLAYRGVSDVSRVHAPAGLDIGASSPGEVAVSVLAEALAMRSGADSRSLADRSERT
jgi:xanthine dehydrogenase accessory factor